MLLVSLNKNLESPKTNFFKNYDFVVNRQTRTALWTYQKKWEKQEHSKTYKFSPMRSQFVCFPWKPQKWIRVKNRCFS